eukprot:447539-Heterocapsa_arctica.AAC.1
MASTARAELPRPGLRTGPRELGARTAPFLVAPPSLWAVRRARQRAARAGAEAAAAAAAAAPAFSGSTEYCARHR